MIVFFVGDKELIGRKDIHISCVLLTYRPSINCLLTIINRYTMPATKQVQPTLKMKFSVEKMTKAQVQKLKLGVKVDVYHRATADDQSRLVLESISVAMLKAFSKGFGDDLLKKKQVTVTGGDIDSLKALIKWMFSFCDDKKAMPALIGPELCAWMRIHQAAELVDAPLVANMALAEIRNSLERITDTANVEAVAKAFPANSRYVKMLIPNVARAAARW